MGKAQAVYDAGLRIETREHTCVEMQEPKEMMGELRQAIGRLFEEVVQSLRIPELLCWLERMHWGRK